MSAILPSRRRSCRREADAPAGFTLIEMVVALFLLSLMSLIVYESYRGGLAMWEGQYRGGSSLDSARVVVQRLRSQLKSAYPWYFRSQNKQVIYFRGRRDAIEFASLNGFSSRRESGMLHLMRLALEQGEDGPRLRVEEYAFPRRDFPQDGDDPLVNETIPGVEEFLVRYQIETRKSPAAPASRAGAAREAESSEKRWADSWPDETGPKRNETVTAVSVSLKVKTGDGTAEELTTVVPFMKSWLDAIEGGA